MGDGAMFGDLFGEDADEIDLSEFVTEGENGAAVLRLEYPIARTVKRNGRAEAAEPIEELVLHRPRMRDLEQLDLQDTRNMKSIRAMIHSMLRTQEIRQEHLLDMDAADFTRVMAVVAGFFPKPPRRQTGGT